MGALLEDPNEVPESLPVYPDPGATSIVLPLQAELPFPQSFSTAPADDGTLKDLLEPLRR